MSNPLPVATIRTSDPDSSDRVELHIVKTDDGYTIVTGTGEDTGMGAYPTRFAALDAMRDIWSGSNWDMIEL